MAYTLDQGTRNNSADLTERLHQSQTTGTHGYMTLLHCCLINDHLPIYIHGIIHGHPVTTTVIIITTIENGTNKLMRKEKKKSILETEYYRKLNSNKTNIEY